MSYKSRRYQEGLSGKKPGWVVIDEEGHAAQEDGYRDHLRNEDLVSRMQETRRGSSAMESYYESAPGPSTTRKSRIIQTIVALGIFWLDLQLTEGMFHTRWASPNDPHAVFIFIVTFVVLPGGILFWPGIALLLAAWWKN